MCSHNYSDVDCDFCKGPHARIAELEAQLVQEREKLTDAAAAFVEISAHMHVCIIQRVDSDDAIIFDHIETAKKLADASLSQTKEGG